jgi:hypothetical protein
MLFPINHHYAIHKDVIDPLWIAVRVILEGIRMRV